MGGAAGLGLGQVWGLGLIGYGFVPGSQCSSPGRIKGLIGFCDAWVFWVALAASVGSCSRFKAV